MADTATAAPPQVMQGIEVPASSVNPQAFFRATRRLRFPMKGGSFAGMGLTDNVNLLQTGIISQLWIRFVGSLVVTPGTGAVATTSRWPYDLVRACRVSANAQSNLINCSGAKLKVRDIMGRGDLTDRGVSRGIGGASPGTARTDGSLSLASESWGVGQNVSAIASGTYAVDLLIPVPLAFDQINLMGAIFAQTSATDLNLSVDWAPSGDLFTLTGNGAVALTGTYQIEGTVFSIPQGPNGDVIVPDLSVFHSLIQSRASGLSAGVNEVRLAGQGVGRQLLRVFWQTWNGSPSAPLPVTETNFAQIGWRYGGNDTPELFPALAGSSHLMRYETERMFNSDLGVLQGIKVFDFCQENAFRDSIDEGAATELRFFEEIQSGVSLSSPFIEYVQETAFAGPVGA